MSFVFGQIPITDTILVRYVLIIGITCIECKVFTKPMYWSICIAFYKFTLKIGYDLKMIFTFASFIAIGVLVSSVILPSQGKKLNPNI